MAEWKKKRRTMRHYDRLAKVYDAQYGEEQETKIKAALNSLKLGNNDVVLDAGCGTGLLFPHIAKRVELVAGLDLSSHIIQEAKKRARQLPNAALLRADADQTPFRNQTFDTVFAVTLLQNTPNPLRTLEEIKRVSKNQAVIVATGLKKQFTQEGFTKLLHQARLNIKVLKTNEKLKGYVAVCTKSNILLHSERNQASDFSSTASFICNPDNQNNRADEAQP